MMPVTSDRLENPEGRWTCPASGSDLEVSSGQHEGFGTVDPAPFTTWTTANAADDGRLRGLGDPTER